jgi:hypothetical protein
MIGLSYTGFVVPIPNVDEYNDFITHLPFSPSLKRRLSTSKSDLPRNVRDSEGVVLRPNDKAGVLRRKWRMLVDGRIHTRERYILIS